MMVVVNASSLIRSEDREKVPFLKSIDFDDFSKTLSFTGPFQSLTLVNTKYKSKYLYTFTL